MKLTTIRNVSHDARGYLKGNIEEAVKIDMVQSIAKAIIDRSDMEKREVFQGIDYWIEFNILTKNETKEIFDLMKQIHRESSQANRDRIEKIHSIIVGPHQEAGK